MADGGHPPPFLPFRFHSHLLSEGKHLLSCRLVHHPGPLARGNGERAEPGKVPQHLVSEERGEELQDERAGTCGRHAPSMGLPGRHQPGRTRVHAEDRVPEGPLFLPGQQQAHLHAGVHVEFQGTRLSPDVREDGKGTRGRDAEIQFLGANGPIGRKAFVRSRGSHGQEFYRKRGVRCNEAGYFRGSCGPGCHEEGGSASGREGAEGREGVKLSRRSPRQVRTPSRPSSREV